MSRKPSFTKKDYPALIESFKSGALHRDIAEEWGINYYTISRYKNYFLQEGLLSKEEIPVKKRGIPKGRFLKGNASQDFFWDDVLCLHYTQAELAQKWDISRQSVSNRLESKDISSKDYADARKKQSEELRYWYQRLVTLLPHYYFDRTIEKESLDMALAFRCRDIYGVGRLYSLETLAQIIHARLEGNGYHRALRLAGDPDPKARVAHIQRILDVALHDVAYEKPKRAFGKENQKYLVTEEEEKNFIQDWNAEVDPHILAERYFDGKSNRQVYFHAKRLGLEKRDIHRL